MIKIKYKNENEMHEVEFVQYSPNVITLVGNVPHNESGFNTFQLNGDYLGEFGEYKTLYDSGSNYVSYSNDGSVYTPTPEPGEDDTAEITLEERINDLEIALCEIVDSLA